MIPIAVFYHCVFFKDDGEELERALPIVLEQMWHIKDSGLEDAASHFVIGVNGGEESLGISDLLLPKKAVKIYHGLLSKAENPTIMEIETWAKTHPGWAVLYFHAKGSSYPQGSSYGEHVSDPWRRLMMGYLVGSWRECVQQLERGYDVACCQWLWGMEDGSQHIPAGNFLWAKSDFISSLPSMMLRESIKTHGIGSLEARYEAEVYWGNGRLPNVFQIIPRGEDGWPEFLRRQGNIKPLRSNVVTVGLQ